LFGFRLGDLWLRAQMTGTTVSWDIRLTGFGERGLIAEHLI